MTMDLKKKPNVSPKVHIRVLHLILLTTLTSTSASLTGGLVMYFESIASLQDTIDQVSKAEVHALGLELNKTLGSLGEMALNIETVVAHSKLEGTAELNSQNWHDMIISLNYGVLTAFPNIEDMGVTLIPDHPDDPRYFYSHLWYDVSAGGGKEYVSGSYHYGHRNDPSLYNLSKEPFQRIHSQVRKFNMTNGEVHGPAIYTIPVQAYWEAGSEWNLTDPDFSPTGGWVRKPAMRMKVVRFRNPAPWAAADGTTYSFLAFDTFIKITNPLHPWSGYKMVGVHSMMVFGEWDRLVKKYRDEHPNTGLTVLDRTNEYVYATTLNISMTGYTGCLEDRKPHTSENLCITKLHMLPGTLREAWQSVSNHSPSLRTVFMVSSSGGSKHFIRRFDVYTSQTQPDHDPAIDVVILWVMPASAVEAKVERALFILLVFVGGVFVFDIAIAVLEVYLIAKPIQAISRASAEMGGMQLRLSKKYLLAAQRGVFGIKEVTQLVHGIHDTIDSLADFRMYVPQSVLPDEKHLGTQPPEGNITVVFTDIHDSTVLWEADPTTMDISLHLHNDVLRSCIEAHDGYEVKTMGDAFMVAFADEIKALRFGKEVQLALLNTVWPSTLFIHTNKKPYTPASAWNGLRVRMGIHMGHGFIEYNPVNGRADYKGPVVNKAARIEGQALPGMIAVSSEIRNSIGSACDELQMSVKLLGTRCLKGIGQVELYYLLPHKLAERELLFLPKLASIVPVAEQSLLKQNSKCKSSRNSSARGIHRQPLSRNLHEAHGAIAVIHSTGPLFPSIFTAVPEENDNIDLTDALFEVNCFMQGVTDRLKLTEGRVSNVFGGCVTVTWNLAARCNTYFSQVLRFCGMMETKTSGSCQGAAVGPSVHGNVGSTSARYHTLAGPALFAAFELSKKCKEDGLRTLVTYCETEADATPVQLSSCLSRHGELSSSLGTCASYRIHAESCVEIRVTWSDEFNEPTLINPLRNLGSDNASKCTWTGSRPGSRLGSRLGSWAGDSVSEASFCQS